MKDLHRRSFLAGSAAAAAVLAGMPASSAENSVENSVKPIEVTGEDLKRADCILGILRRMDGDLLRRTSHTRRSRALNMEASELSFSKELVLSARAQADLDEASSWEKRTAVWFESDGHPEVVESAIRYGNIESYEISGQKVQVVPVLTQRRLNEKQVWTETDPFVLCVGDNDLDVQRLWRPEAAIANIPNFVHRLVDKPSSHWEFKDLLPIEEYGLEDMLKLEVEAGNFHMGSRGAAVPLGSTGRMKAAKYGRDHARVHNPKYRFFGGQGQGGDCTNFVSQAMRAGGWPDKLGLWNGASGWWYNSTLQSHTWVNVGKFRAFATEQGRTRSARYVGDLWHGNVLQVRKSDASGWIHSAIVTGRVNNQPLLSYHTVDTLDIPFSRFRGKYNEKAQGFKWHFHLT